MVNIKYKNSDDDYIMQYIYRKWNILCNKNNKHPIFNPFYIFISCNIESIVEVFKDTQATMYEDYKKCFDMYNLGIKYNDKDLEFIFNELLEIFK